MITNHTLSLTCFHLCDRVNPLEKLQLSILKVTMDQYQRHHHDKELLRKASQKLGTVEIESQCDLEQVRNMLKSRFVDMICYPRISNDWCFIDCKLASNRMRTIRVLSQILLHLHFAFVFSLYRRALLPHRSGSGTLALHLWYCRRWIIYSGSGRKPSSHSVRGMRDLVCHLRLHSETTYSGPGEGAGAQPTGGGARRTAAALGRTTSRTRGRGYQHNGHR